LIVENENKQKLTKESLEKFFEEFKERIKKKYGDEISSLYYMKERKYKGKQYIVFGRKHKKISDARIKRFVSFFFDLERQRVYIPVSYIVRYPRLVNFAILRTLGELGLVKKEYQG
jgi:ABC-type transporter MlaC component